MDLRYVYFICSLIYKGNQINEVEKQTSEGKHANSLQAAIWHKIDNV